MYYNVEQSFLLKNLIRWLNKCCFIYLQKWTVSIKTDLIFYKPLGIRQVQGCIVQHGEQSQYFLTTVCGK